MIRGRSLTCDFFRTTVAFSGECPPVEDLSSSLSSFLNFDVVIPRRLPAFVIQSLFSALKFTSAEVVGRGCDCGVVF